MSRMRPDSKAIRYALSGVLAAGLLAGCASSGASHLARAGEQQVRSAGKLNRAVDSAEGVVERSPNDAAARLALAQAYLEAGRFDSAATTYGDVVKLGDTSARTQLSLALAHIGAGHREAALAVLDDARDSIPASDRGLALALAGETGRGIAILTDAVRGGDNTPKVRQNLAYAFALDGRWREARIAMAQDVPADAINDRIGEWAMMAQPEAVQRRVASLLGVPSGVADAGQPQALALGGAASGEQLAATETEAPVSAAPVAQTAVAELPALDQVPTPAAPVAAVSEAPVVATIAPAPAVVAPAAAPAPTGFATAFAPQPGFVSQPVVQPIPTRAPAPAARVARIVAPAPRPATPATNGTHLVQLGSFSSEANARRATQIFAARNPELRNRRLTVTAAVVNGKTFWRVAAAGLDGSGARRLCSDVRSRGGACFAYAPTGVPGSAKPVPALAWYGERRAFRR